VQAWDRGAYCSGFYSAGSGGVLIGANAMLNHDFIFDMEHSQLGIVPARASCQVDPDFGNVSPSPTNTPTPSGTPTSTPTSSPSPTVSASARGTRSVAPSASPSSPVSLTPSAVQGTTVPLTPTASIGPSSSGEYGEGWLHASLVFASLIAAGCIVVRCCFNGRLTACGMSVQCGKASPYSRLPPLSSVVAAAAAPAFKDVGLQPAEDGEGAFADDSDGELSGGVSEADDSGSIELVGGGDMEEARDAVIV
jgi:hypothetical protein